jgi:hypothetical protein
MDTKQIPLSYSTTYATWNPSLPTITQSRQAAIESIQQNFQYLNDTLVTSGGFVSKAGDTMVGPLNFNAKNSGSSGIGLKYWKTDDTARWQLQMTSGDETGSNAGSTLLCGFYRDDGSYATAWFINRSDGIVRFGYGAAGASFKASSAASWDVAGPWEAQFYAENTGSTGDAGYGFGSRGTYGSIRLVAGTRYFSFIMNDGEYGTVRAAKFQSTQKAYYPANGATVTLQNSIANDFIIAAQAGDVINIVFETTPVDGTVYRIVLRGGTGTVWNWPSTVKWPLGAPDISAAPTSIAVVTILPHTALGWQFANIAIY